MKTSVNVRNTSKLFISVLVLLLSLVATYSTMAQGIAINTTGADPDASAAFDIQSTTGGLLIPRMTLATRNDINAPAAGLLIYQTDATAGFYYYNGSAWVAVGAGETDPVFNAWDKSYNDLINKPDLSGFIDEETDPIFSIWNKSTGISISESQISDLGTYIENETDPGVPAHVKAITTDNISDWNTAHGWGNHAAAGYLTDYTETDLLWSASPSFGISNTDITNWNMAHSWGNHDGLYRPIAWVPAWTDVTSKPTFATVATSGSYSDLTNQPTILNSQWTSTGSDIYYNTGNVGIGTTTPAYKLHIQDATSPALAIQYSTNTDYPYLSSNASNDLVIGSVGSGSHSVFKSNGNVGIGTTTPYTTLTVGSTDATAKITAGGPNTHLTLAAAGPNGNIYLNAGGVASGNYSTSTRLSVGADGNVGIGTTGPAYKLDVNGSINGTSVLVNGVPVASSTDTYWSTAGSGKIQYSGGNVGVGVSSPSYALDVAGDVNISGNFRVNGAPLTGTGTVTSIDASGGTTGLTFTGGPVTTSGTLTMGGTLAIANGGTNATTASGARTNLGATTVGSNLFTLANPSAITFPRFNADNSVSALNAADFRTAIGAGTGVGSVTSVSAGNGMVFTTITGSGSVTMGTPSSLTNSTTNALTTSSHTHAVTTVLPSSTSAGIMLHSGVKTSGGFYGGTTTPTNTTRANYDGYFYATQLFDGANRVFSAGNTNIGTGAANYAAGNHAHSGMGTVTSVTGTSPISVATGTTTPVISLNTVPVTIGGTGTSTAPSQGGIIYASSTSAYSSTAAGTAGYLLKSNGTSAPSWLSTVPVTNGGTGSASAPTQGGIIYASSTSAYSSTAAGTSGQVLTSNGTSAPTWTTVATTPAGVIQQYAGASAPTGYLLCQGQAVSRSTYAALFAVVGTTYGSGDGSTTFNLPDLRQRVPVGKHTTGSFSTLGSTGGTETHTITTAQLPSHNHGVGTLATASGGSHSHTLMPYSASDVKGSSCSSSCNDRVMYNSDGALMSNGGRTTSSDGSHSHTVSGSTASTGTGSAIPIVQPYIVLNYIIKY